MMMTTDSMNDPRIVALIATAQEMTATDAKRETDQGTCVLGAGIAIDVKVGRKERRRIVVGAPFQGNVGSFRACARALAFLQSEGLDAYWHDGNMD